MYFKVPEDVFIAMIFIVFAILLTALASAVLFTFTQKSTSNKKTKKQSSQQK